MIWINDYPEHACVLAKSFADSMLLDPTKVWLDSPTQPQHNKYKICGTRHEAKTSETRQSSSRTLSIPRQTFHPPGNVRSGCGMWTSSSQDIIKTQRVNPKSLNT